MYRSKGIFRLREEIICEKNLKKVILFLILINVGFGDIAQNLGYYYSINKGKVYYVPNGIIYATLYGKDKYNVYYIENKMINCFDTYYSIYEVNGINKDKVEVLNKWFIKDDKNIYFKGEILEGVDYNTFEVLPNGDGKDKDRSYEYLTKDELKWF